MLDETLLLLLLEVDGDNCLARLWEEEEKEVGEEEDEEEEDEDEDEDEEVDLGCFLFLDAMVSIVGPCARVNHGLLCNRGCVAMIVAVLCRRSRCDLGCHCPPLPPKK